MDAAQIETAMADVVMLLVMFSPATPLPKPSRVARHPARARPDARTDSTSPRRTSPEWLALSSEQVS